MGVLDLYGDVDHDEITETRPHYMDAHRERNGHAGRHDHTRKPEGIARENGCISSSVAIAPAAWTVSAPASKAGCVKVGVTTTAWVLPPRGSVTSGTLIERTRPVRE